MAVSTVNAEWAITRDGRDLNDNTKTLAHLNPFPQSLSYFVCSNPKSHDPAWLIVLFPSRLTCGYSFTKLIMLSKEDIVGFKKDIEQTLKAVSKKYGVLIIWCVIGTEPP